MEVLDSSIPLADKQSDPISCSLTAGKLCIFAKQDLTSGSHDLADLTAYRPEAACPLACSSMNRTPWGFQAAGAGSTLRSTLAVPNDSRISGSCHVRSV